MASGGTTQAAAAAAMAAAAMLADKRGKGKRGKRKADDMHDGMFPPPGMMGGGFPMQPWNNPYGNMNLMQQQYFHMMMAQQLAAAQQGCFNMNGMGSGDNEGGNQGNDVNGTPQKQFQGGMPFFPPYPMMGMPPQMMQNMPPNMNTHFQGDPEPMCQPIPNQMQSPPPQVNMNQSPVKRQENLDDPAAYN